MQHKNFKNIDKVVFGRGAFGMLDEILAPRRNENNKYFVFIVDNYFKGKELENKIPVKSEDIVLFEDVDQHEPTTEQIDRLRDKILSEKGLPSGVVGIGGGSIMDIAKDKDDAMKNAAHYLTQLAATFARDWNRVIDSQP